MTISRKRKYSVSQAKNFMQRTVAELVDQSPSNAELNEMWTHFGGQCCYCTKALSPRGRDWHLDHADAGGGNHAGNRVPACSTCNGDEKREQGWLDFLSTKLSGDEFSDQERLIRGWLESHARPENVPSSNVQAARAELDGLIVQFAQKCYELRDLTRVNAGPTSPRGR